MYLIFTIKLIFVFVLIVAYYKYVKQIIMRSTSQIIRFFGLTKYFPVEDIKGAVELAFIALSHIIFCFLLLRLLNVSLPFVSLSFTSTLFFILYGILLGIGCMSVSSICCKAAIQIATSLTNKYQWHDTKTWIITGRGGWIKHHLQSLEIFPIYISLAILIMQVGSEEIIFRGIIYYYFTMYGTTLSCLISISFFVLMQLFLMNKWEAAIFPMIGAFVMGVVHTILYMHVPLLWPLIIAHVTFFIFSVI